MSPNGVWPSSLGRLSMKILAVDLARKQHAVAIERQERVFQPLECLEVARRGDADRRAVVPAAPSDVIRAVDLAQRADRRRSRAASSPDRRSVLEYDRLRLDVPIEAIVAPADVEVREAGALFQAEHADEAVAEGGDRAVVDP